MTKFGDIINTSTPTLIEFYDKNTIESKAILRSVVTSLQNEIKVMRIDTTKNEALKKALRIKPPTYIIYKEGDIKWRQSGVQNTSNLIDMLRQFI